MSMRPPSPARRPARLTLGAVALLICASACDNRQGEVGVKPARPATPASSSANALGEVERLTGLRFPEGVVLVRYERASDSDALVRARLTMTPTQWAAFLAALSVAANAFEEEKRYLLGTNEGWWTPKGPAQLPTAQVRRPDAKVLDLGVDRSDPQRLQVYLVWHAT
jgi:hypothetical protein